MDIDKLYQKNYALLRENQKLKQQMEQREKRNQQTRYELLLQIKQLEEINDNLQHTINLWITNTKTVNK